MDKIRRKGTPIGQYGLDLDFGVLSRSVYSLRVSTMAFFTIFARYITVDKGISNLAICGYTPNTNKIGIRPFRLVVLLKALNTIYKTISLLILSSSTTIIW